MFNDLTLNLLNIKSEMNDLSSASNSPVSLLDNCNELLIKDDFQTSNESLNIDSKMLSQKNSKNLISDFVSNDALNTSNSTPESSDSLVPFFQHLDRLIEASQTSSLINDSNNDYIQNNSTLSNNLLLNSIQKNKNFQNNLNEQNLLHFFSVFSNKTLQKKNSSNF